MLKLIDTNILLENPIILSEIDNVVLSLRVLEEIDGLKKNPIGETAYQARRATYFIKQNIKNIKFYTKIDRKLSVDDDLLRIAKKEKYELVTNDINLQIKCRMKNILFSSKEKESENYTGVKYLISDFDKSGYNQMVYDIIENKKPPFEMCENEFLIIKDKNEDIVLNNGDIDYKTKYTFIFKDGELSSVIPLGIKNSHNNFIKARNSEQECLMSVLANKDISILLAAGTFGVGKSYLLINYALQELQRGNIQKIVYIPNNSFNENTREVGALPGDLFEKELIHMGTLVDIVGIDSIQSMVETDQVEVVPVSVIRGRNFINSIIIVNEAQNLTEDHVKLLIARCGEGTRIFFDGDIKQSDNHIFRNKNGLRLLVNLRKSPIFSKIFGTIRLKNIERSLTARASAYLDECN